MTWHDMASLVIPLSSILAKAAVKEQLHSKDLYLCAGRCTNVAVSHPHARAKSYGVSLNGLRSESTLLPQQLIQDLSQGQTFGMQRARYIITKREYSADMGSSLN